METIKLIGRSSRLSLLQIDIVKKKIQSAFPKLKVEIIARSSKGDVLQEIPLHTIEGSDFFTQDIFDALGNGEADIAVHSLKDMSSEHFFGNNAFAVVDREDARDIAIFHKDVLEKIENGNTIVIGTCSPRREEIATDFLQKALPQLNSNFKITTKFIRGNVDTRLTKLDKGEFDGIILATAGLNRLLKKLHLNPPQRGGLSEFPNKETVMTDSEIIKELLADKKIMLLPLIECVPAPCQGAIVAEANPANEKAVEILKSINDENLYTDCFTEKKEAIKYGAGCIQKFGVTTLNTKNGKYLYAAGKDSEGTDFVKWDPLPELKIEGAFFSSTDLMKVFFDYEWTDKKISFNTPIVFVANYKAIQNSSIELLSLNRASQLKLKSSFLAGSKKILASGTRTWFELAKKGYWVTASADALGFEFLLPSLQMPLINIQPEEISILTHERAAKRWRKKGYDAVSNYKLLSKNNKDIQQAIAEADIIFWSSFSQYEFYGKHANENAKHLCAGGETAELLKEAGVVPVIFPTIKAFEQWRKSSIRSHSVA